MIVVGNQLPRGPVASGNDERTGNQIKVGLAVFHFDRPCKNVVTQSKIEGQPFGNAEVVLGEESVLPTPGSDSAQGNSVLVAVHETSQNIGDFVIGVYVASSTPGAASRAISRQPKVTLGVVTAKQIQFAAKDCSTNLHRVPALNPRQTVAVVKARLRDQIRPTVAGILQLTVVSTDESDTTQQRCIAVDDSELRAEIDAVERVQVSVKRPHEAYVRFIHHRRSQRAGQTD